VGDEVSEQGDLFAGPTCRQDEIVDDFIAWIRKDPMAWRHFRRIALIDIERGRRYLSASAITERVRYETRGEKDEAGVRIRNAFRAYLARLFEVLHPEHQGVFRLNRTPSAEQPANGKQWHIDQTRPNEDAIERRITRRLEEFARELPRDPKGGINVDGRRPGEVDPGNGCRRSP
jgi:hypothetical protein